MPHFITIAILLTCCFSATAEEKKLPREVFEDSRSAFASGDFEKALPLLTFLLYPQPKLSSASDLEEAHVLLGICHYETGNDDDARRELETALFLNPTLELSPAIFSPRARKFLAELKAQVEKSDKENREIKALADERDALRERLANTVIVEKRPYYINFVPFGAGQFQNGHRRTGLIFFTSQLALGGTSATLFSYQVVKYGIGGSVPPDELKRVNNIRKTQVVTGAACLVSMAAGIVHALIHHESEVVLESGSKKTANVIPYVTPVGSDGVTFGIGGSF